MDNATSRALDLPGATVAYDVLERHESAHRPLMFIGHPMGASGFQTLSAYFPDRTLITYDPRGAERSTKSDPMEPSPPDVHGDDLHAVIQAAGAGPVDMFASSGGAITSLALVAKYPNDVHTLVAHEPPLMTVLPDADAATAVAQAVHNTYEEHGWGAGMAHFIALTSRPEPFAADIAAQPAPDPSMFGMPTEDDGKRSDPLLGPTMLTIVTYEPDWDALRAASTRIVIGAGEASEGLLANRGAYGVAQKLGSQVVKFPGGHGGFNRSEWEPSDPDAFAARLRELLDATA